MVAVVKKGTKSVDSPVKKGKKKIINFILKIIKSQNKLKGEF